MKVLYLSQHTDTHQPFFAHLHRTTELLRCIPQQEIIEGLLEIQKINAVIGFEEHLSMIKSIIQQFPMVNYALISSRSTDDFHAVTEGYGFFMQLPTAPGRDDAEKFLEILAAITIDSTMPAKREGEKP